MALIDPSRLQVLLGDLAGRFDVDAVDRIDSSNDELGRRAASGAASGSVLVADEQTAGRGRRGRPWQSTAADSLTFSLLWRLPVETPSLAGLSLAVGLALTQSLEQLGLPGVALKWPNDLLWPFADGRYGKLGGILIELASDRRGTQAVIGIGLNLRRPPADIDQITAGLSDTGFALPERHALLAALLRQLAATLDQFAASGFASLREDWQGRHAWQNRAVDIHDEQRVHSGLCRGVDRDGALLLDIDGRSERILAGDVSLRLR